MNKKQLESLTLLSQGIISNMIHFEHFCIDIETVDDVMFNEYPSVSDWEDNAQWIDMYRVYIQPNESQYNIEVYPWSWAQTTTLSENPIALKMDSDRLAKFLDPETMNSQLCEMYPDTFRKEEEE